jgi:Cu/Ag efflux pump CusA
MTVWLIGSSLRLARLVIAVAIAILGFGLFQLRTAPVDAYPEFMPPMVQIQADALGLSAAEVEQLITVPLEQDLLNGVPWLERISSESMPGLAQVDLVFEPGTDVLKARQLVQERLAQAVALPNVGTRPVMVQPLSSMSRVMMIGLSSKDLSLIDMSVLARWKIRPKLQGIPGVANVAIWGQRDRQLQVQVDPQRLQANGVSLSQVIDSTGNALWSSPLTFVEASTPGTGGFIDTTNQRLGVQHIFPITTPKQLASVALEETGGKRLRLSDVAGVVEDHQPLIGDARTEQGPSLMLVIEKFPAADTLTVTRDIEEAMAALSPGLSGVQVDTHVYRPADYIEASLRSIGTRGLIGLILVIGVLGIFTFSWRRALISLVAIATSLVAAALVLYLRGVTFNVITLAGLVLALGAIVDDAVGDVHAIGRRVPQPDGGRTAVDAIVEAIRSRRRLLTYATLIMLLAVVPLALQGGVDGAFSRALVTAYVPAVLVSWLVAVTLTPALSHALLGVAPGERRPSPAARLVERTFDRTIPRLLLRPIWASATVAVLILAVIAVVVPSDRNVFLPTPQDRSLIIEVGTVPGTSLQEMNRITASISGDVRAVSGVRNVGVLVGRAITSDHAADVNSGELWVEIAKSADYTATIGAVRGALNGYPGVRHKVLTYQQQRLAAAESRDERPLVVRVFGPDLGVLRTKAEEVRRTLEGIKGVKAPRVELSDEEPVLQVQVDLAAAQRYGIRPGDVRRAAATLMSGLLAGNLYENQEVFDVVVWGTPAARQDVASVGSLPIDTPSGGHVPLRDVATVRVAKYPPAIKHEDVSRYVDVTAEVSGRGLGSVRRDTADRVQTLAFPLEHHAEVLDEPGRQHGAGWLSLLVLTVLIGMFLLLQASTGSWRIAAMLLVLLPLAAVGGALSAELTAGVVSAGALIGLLVGLGVMVRNGILQVDRYQSLAAEGGTDLRTVVVQGTRDRVVPVLLTASVLAAAVLPFAILGNSAGVEILHPFAVVVLGGLVSSTVISLFVLPASYLRLAPAIVHDEPAEPAADHEKEQEEVPDVTK